ncbi:MAG: PilW family protein [Gammaproteobacteria bacterium]|nr:PilW family protein [Gammaproteobacteria bacterium]MBU1601533.1 PilW family protein [Gammaproteobacteria bacterium]MBU2433728.1 PilW family protein [Gammaproteobacteria bacterium]
MSGKYQRGLLLIELMVGLFIGLLTTLAITQVLSIAEGQRRAATSGGDAQVSGSVSLHTIQRELRQAGYGLGANPAALGCQIKGSYGGSNVSITLAPIVITDGASGASDSLSVLSSSRDGATVPVLITSDHLKADTEFWVKGTFTVAVDDYLIAVPEAWDSTHWCSLFKAATPTTVTKITHADMSSYAPDDKYSANTSYLLNLGRSIRSRSYAVNAQNVLQMTELDSTAQDIAPEIVNLQALYGKDTNGDRVIDAYDTTAPSTAAGWQQVIAVRVALVSRSMEYEREEVTSSLPEWDVGTAISVSGAVDCASGSGGKCVQIKVDNLTNWKHYRYKVYDTLIPLRNMLWNS